MLQLMNMDMGDLDELFNALDVDRSGEIDYAEFVEQMHKMKSLDIKTCMRSGVLPFSLPCAWLGSVPRAQMRACTRACTYLFDSVDCRMDPDWPRRGGVDHRWQRRKRQQKRERRHTHNKRTREHRRAHAHAHASRLRNAIDRSTLVVARGMDFR